MPIQDPLTQQIICLSYRVANALGHGFVEQVHENALAFELRRAKIEVRRLGMSPGKGTGTAELEVKGVQ
jgi:hypothetical protein